MHIKFFYYLAHHLFTLFVLIFSFNHHKTLKNRYDYVAILFREPNIAGFGEFIS